MNDPDNPYDHDSIADAAAQWCMRLQEPDCTEAERSAFTQWLAADPAHAVEYQAMLKIWDLADHLPRIPTAMVTPPPIKRRVFGRYATAAAISLLAIPVAGIAGWHMGWLPDSWQSIEAVDEMRHVVLADGSEVELNLGTDLSYANYKDQRRVTLEKGEAFFKVSHSTEHPFVVRAAAGQVRATGTEFNVWKYEDKVRVTLLKGSVLVNGNRDREGYRLDPGMQASYRFGDIEPKIRQTYAGDTSLAWRNGTLVLDNLSLDEALPLINRYLEHPVQLADTATGKIRIVGVYSTRNVKGLVNSLPKVLPVYLTENKDGNPVLSRAPKT